jgi:hypothetical protein
MSRIVVVILIHRRHKPIDLTHTSCWTRRDMTMQKISHSIAKVNIHWKLTLHTRVELDVLEHRVCDASVWVSRRCHTAVQTDVKWRDSFQIQN